METDGLRRLSGRIVAFAALAVLADAAVETYLASSPLRWWAVGAVAVVVVLGAASSRLPLLRRAGAWMWAALCVLVFLALLAVSMRPDTGTLHALGVGSERLLYVAMIAGLAAAALTVALQRSLKPVLRAGFVALAGYGVVSFALALDRGTPILELLASGGFWQWLPFWARGAVVGSLLVLPLAIFYLALARLVTGPAQWRGLHGVLVAGLAGLLIVPLTQRLDTAVTLPSLAGGDSGRAAGGGTADVSRRLQGLTSLVEATARAMAKAEPDPIAIVGDAGPEPRALSDWVREHIGFTPYRGVLHGARGTLSARSGNSLDRALLLSGLLEEAGHSSRLARARLSGPALSRAVAAVRQAPEAQPQPVSFDPARHLEAAGLSSETYQQAAERLTRRREARVREVTDRIERQSKRLTELVAPALEGVGPTDMNDALADHWWVQVRGADGWSDLDPTLTDGAAPALAEAEETFSRDELPDRMFHRLSVSVRVQFAHRGTLLEKEVLNSRFRVADVRQSYIRFANVPVNLPEDWYRDGDAERALLEGVTGEREWLPVLVVNGEPRFRWSVRTDGGLIDVTSPEANTMRLGETVSGATEEVVGGALDQFGSMFAGEDDGDDGDDHGIGAQRYVAQYLDFEVTGPGYEPVTVEREVFDLLGPARRRAQSHDVTVTAADERQRGLALVSARIIQPFSGRVADATIVQHQLNGVAAVLEAIRTGPGGGDDIGEQFQALDQRSGRLLAFAALRERYGPADGILMTRPGVVMMHEDAVREADGIRVRPTLDVVYNPASGTTDGGRGVLAQGVADTNVEAGLMGEDYQRLGNVANLFARDGDWRLVRSLQRLDDLDLSDDAEARIAGALDNGYLIVAPSEPVHLAGTAREGWWQIDPGSGRTLGMMASGRGSAQSEYMILSLSIWRTSFMLSMSLKDCQSLECFGCNIAFALMTTGLDLISMGAGRVGAEIAGATVSTVNVGLGGAGVAICSAEALR